MSDMVAETLKMLKSMGMQAAQVTPRDAVGRAICTVLIVDEPDDAQIAAVNALTEKWTEDESGA